MCPPSARRSGLIQGPSGRPRKPGARGDGVEIEGGMPPKNRSTIFGGPRASPAQRVAWGEEEQGSGRSFRRPGGNGAKRTLRRRGGFFVPFWPVKKGHPRPIPRNAAVAGTSPLIRPSVRTGAPSPAGKAFFAFSWEKVARRKP